MPTNNLGNPQKTHSPTCRKGCYQSEISCNLKQWGMFFRTGHIIQTSPYIILCQFREMVRTLIS